MSEPRYRHLFHTTKGPRVWTSKVPHAYGLVRLPVSSNTELGGEGLIKAFTAEEREEAIAFSKHQRDYPIHDGYKLKLVKLEAEEFTPSASPEGRAGGSHASCDHPATPSARRECRARRKAGIL